MSLDRAGVFGGEAGTDGVASSPLLALTSVSTVDLRKGDALAAGMVASACMAASDGGLVPGREPTSESISKECTERGTEAFRCRTLWSVPNRCTSGEIGTYCSGSGKLFRGKDSRPTITELVVKLCGGVTMIAEAGESLRV